MVSQRAVRLSAPVVVLLILAVASPLWSQLPTATLNGIVTDPQGAAVAGAKVTLISQATGVKRETTTGDAGQYVFAELPAGDYTLRIERSGFAPREYKDLRLEVGRAVTIDARLTLATVGQQVIVTEAEAGVQLTQSEVQGQVTSTTIETIPLNGRNFLELAFLIPGNRPAVNYDPTKTNTLEVSSAGQFGRGGNISVDGGDNNDEVVGGTLSNFAEDSVKEFQIATNRYTAEVGRSASSIINIISKSGTNEYHGSGFIFVRNRNLQGLPATFDRRQPTPPFDRQQYGGSVGGPIKRDKAFWFFSIENRHQNHSVQAAFRDISAGYTNGKIVSSSAPALLRDTMLTGTGDVKLTGRDRLFLRYSFNRSREIAEGSPQAPQQTAANRQTSLNRFNSGNANWTRTISATQVNSFIFHFDRFLNNIPVFPENKPTLFGVSTPPNCGAPDRPCEIVFPSLEDGPNFRISQRTRFDRLQFKDTFAWTLGRHTLHFGGEYQKQWSDAIFDLFGSGTIFLKENFATADRNGDGVINDLDIPVAEVDESAAPVRPPFVCCMNNGYVSAYIQDDWRARPNLTFNLGLRWEFDTDVFGTDSAHGPCPTLTTQPTSPCLWVANVLGLHRSPDYRDVGPRFGFAWDPFKKGQTVIRGGYGIYYDRVILEVPLLDQLLDGRRLSLKVFAPAPLFSNPFAGGPSPAGIGIDILDNDIQHPYVQQWTLGLQHQIGKDWLVSADGVHNFGTRFLIGRLLRTQEAVSKVATFPAPIGTVTLLNCPGNFQQCIVTDPLTGATNPVTDIQPSAKTWYDALLLSVQKRPTRFFNDKFGYSFNVNYTLSKAFNYSLDDQVPFKEGKQADIIEGVNDLRLEKGYATTDERHRVVFFGVFDAPYDITISPIWTIASSVPGNPGLAALGAGGRLPILARNSLARNIGNSDQLNAAIDFWNSLPACGGGAFPCRVGGVLSHVAPGMQFGKAFNSFDMRISKMIRVAERHRFQVIGEVFNLFNVTNVRGTDRLNFFGFNNNIDSPKDFNQKARIAGGFFGSGGPRAFQFALRYSF